MVPLSEFGITSYFNRACKVLGEGLHMEYWISHSALDAVDVKIEIIVLANDTEAMENLNAFADTLFFDFYENNKRTISRLKEERKGVYKKLVYASDRPIALKWELPDTIDYSIADDSMAFEQHLFCFNDGSFKASLNPWESGVVKEELANGAVAWLRNLDRKKWSLEIPYEMSGVAASMFPDLIIVRADEQLKTHVVSSLASYTFSQNSAYFRVKVDFSKKPHPH